MGVRPSRLVSLLIRLFCVVFSEELVVFHRVFEMILRRLLDPVSPDNGSVEDRPLGPCFMWRSQTKQKEREGNLVLTFIFEENNQLVKSVISAKNKCF